MRSGAALTASLPLCVAAVGQHHSQAAVRAQGCTQADRAKINLCSVMRLNIVKHQCPLHSFGVNGGFFLSGVWEFCSSHTEKPTSITMCS